MSDYTKIVDFAAKDALITGNPAKLVKGTEIGAELDAISTAIATKHDAADIGVIIQAYDADLTTWAGVTPGTGVATALAVNVGTAGAPVVNGGALGTPASGTLTNATGLPAAGVTGTALVAAAIGTTVQAYDADLTTWAGVTPGTGVATALAVNLGSAGAVASLGTAETFTASQRGTVTADNDLSFNLAVTNNFSCTPSAGGTLTFTNHTAGQSGMILLTNGSNYAIAAAATTKIHATDLATISTTGVWLLCYFDNGTNAYVTVSRNLT